MDTLLPGVNRWRNGALLGGILLFLLVVVEKPTAAEAGIVLGRPEILLSGKPATASSSASCGFVLVASETGPQLAMTARPASCLISLPAGEDAIIEVPIRGLSGEVSVCATAVNLDEGEAEADLVFNGERSHETWAHPGTASLRISTAVKSDELRVRLRFKAGQTDAAMRWRNVRLLAGNQSMEIPLFPGSANVDACPPPPLPNLRRPIEQALIEWDWRMQDGIATERMPVTYAQAVEQTMRQGEALIRDLQMARVDLSDKLAKWRALRREQERLAAAIASDEQKWEALWREVHLARRALVFANPLAHTGPLAFIKQVPSMFSHQLTQYYGSCARPGGGLFVLEAPGQSMTCRQLAVGCLPQGSYQHLDVNYEGDRLLFSYCETSTTPKDREEHLERFYHLYEIKTDGSGLRQLTSGSYDDFSPRFLPDGKLLFVSTRRGGFHRCGRGPCAVYTLATAEADGSNPHPISYHETHEWDPEVLHDGRVIYTRWDYVDRHAVYYEQLWSVRPDGSDVQAYYGNNTFNPVGVWEARVVPGSDRVMATAAAHHAMTAGSIILLDAKRGKEGLEPITRLTPDALFPESEAPVVLAPNSAWVGPAGPGGPSAPPPAAVRWPGHCYRSPLPLSEKYFITAYSFDALIGEPTWNRANMFGLYLVDAFGNKELLYRDLNIASLWPAPMRARPRPAQMPEFADRNAPAGQGTFFLLNVYTSWPELPRDTIKRLRIVQVLPKSTPHANTPMVGIPNASPGKQVIGTVPVEPDGSAYFQAPAGIPLAFQALDAQGQAVQIMRSLTYLQPGERASCIGCHEHRNTAPPQKPSALALQRPPSAIRPGPDGSKPLSYPLLVQPVLDRKCVSCHNAIKADGKIVLTGEPQGRYTISYNALAPKVPYSDWAGRGGDFRQVNSEPASAPDFFGARNCQFMRQLLAGHHDVVLDADEIERLVTWMDVNALFYGTFDPQDQAKQQLGQRIAGPAIQ